MESGASANILALARKKVACKDCSLAQLCLPTGIDSTSLEALERIIRRRKPLKRGEPLFYIDSPFQSVFAIRSGSVKAYSPTEDGQEQVTAFHLPGELVGLDAISSGRHAFAVKALETTSLCEIPFASLEELAQRIPALDRQFRLILTKELELHRDLFLVLGKKSAEERLAALLVNLANRYSQRGLSTSDFNLSMSRNDIANHLGLAVETVSRLFTRFQEEGILSVQRKHVQILDMERLKRQAKWGRGAVAEPLPKGRRRGGSNAAN